MPVSTHCDICAIQKDLTSRLVTADMRLQPNIGSDRSWVWKVAADYAENPPTPETLAIRFANTESEYKFHCVCSFA